jgi:hypothetical protein
MDGSGPRAAGIAGDIYRQLGEADYLVEPPVTPRISPAVPRLTPSSAPMLAKALILIFSSSILILIWRMWREGKRWMGFGH